MAIERTRKVVDQKPGDLVVLYDFPKGTPESEIKEWCIKVAEMVLAMPQAQKSDRSLP